MLRSGVSDNPFSDCTVMTQSTDQIRCPSCGKSFVFDRTAVTMPFCSEQCKWIDLGKWMNEGIGIPHEASDEDTEDEVPPIVREYKFD
jgi:endogenous inhibitor of DNA gyrase (YacG/DUF329 family)